MYLKRLELSGFKSFAARTRLELEPGITAIVGPNGSGKSNIADAIRWALGEQSVRPLRSKKHHELIFAGSEKRPRASLAEVNLLLDNTDGGLELDFSEIELARQLTGGGEAQYRLNRQNVRLHEIQQLLSAAGFGAGSYAVIGQGTIDNLILAPPAERKLLFDEASGIRGYELKRERALRKLQATEQNLIRLRDIITELTPRLANLEKAAQAADESQKTAAELTQVRRQLINAASARGQAELRSIESQQAQLDQERRDLKTRLAGLENERKAHEQTAAQAAKDLAKRAELLQRLEAERDALSGDLSLKRAELQLLEERLKAVGDLPTQLAKLKSEQKQLAKKLAAKEAELAAERHREAATELAVEKLSGEIVKVQSKLNRLRRQMEGSSRQEFLEHAKSILKQLAINFKIRDFDHEQANLLVYKAGRLLSLASRGQAAIQTEIKNVQLELSKLMGRRESAQDDYATVVIKVRSVELDIASLTGQSDQLTVRCQQIEKERAAQKLPSPKVLEQRRTRLQALEGRLNKLTDRLQKERAVAAGENQTSEKSVFKLASELESARASVAVAAEQLQALATRRQACLDWLKRYQDLSKQWFGSQQLPVGEASAASVEELEDRAQLLLGKLEAFEQADQDATEEYKEVSERYQYLTSQVQDLEQALGDLTNVTAQLDKLIKTKFETAAGGIGQHFSRYFERLFSGGKASLKLQPDEEGSYGIELTAQPPGKRVANLSMLSGGERALTGLALLAAILHVNPSPFVVLDEVDAALDEANSLRFAELLTELGDKSQLLVITHNRQTMEAAHTLYGVTMDEHQVSRLLGLKLAEARELAAR